MITQNPIVGRSRKKLAGVYARTLWGKNIIQSLPTPTTIPPTKKQSANRSAFAKLMSMANMVPAPLLSNIYYTAPVGRSRRHVLTSQLFTGIIRNGSEIIFDVATISQLGTNPITTTNSVIFTVPDKSFEIEKSIFLATERADTSRVPCVFAISYDLRVCDELTSYTTIEGDNLHFENISGTLLQQPVLLICLWQTNIGTTQNPIWVYGRFNLEP